MDNVKIKINKEYDGKTIKEFLKDNNVGRGRVEAIRVAKSSFINGEYKNLETKLKENDILSFSFVEEIDFLNDEKDLDVIYEDDYVLLVNKPSDIIIHPDDKTKTGTLVNIVANYYKNKGINRKVRYIHRLDKETTGLILFAKDFLSEAILLKDLQNDNISRKYLAFLEGKLSKKEGIIKANIDKDRHVNGKMCIAKSGKEAISKYKVIEEFKEYSLVEFSLLTGRTHQIRVHASYITHPLLGDVLYGGNMLYSNRVALHSYSISFIHPINKKSIDIKIDLPIDLYSLTK